MLRKIKEHFKHTCLPLYRDVFCKSFFYIYDTNLLIFTSLQGCVQLSLKWFFFKNILLYSHIQIHAHIYIYMLDTYRRNNKRRAKTSLTNMYLSLYCKGSKRLFKVLWWEGVGDRTETAIFWPHSYGHQRCVFLVLLMPTGGPGTHSAGFLYYTLSATSLDPNSSGAPRAPSAWCGFPYHIWSITPSPTVWLLSWLSYIIVQRPLNRLLDLWNGMFDRHQAEITVMQFTGHSLPVHQSMSVPWEF